MISGMAIGSLLVNYIDVSGVFSISVMTLSGTLAFAMIMLPRQRLAGTEIKGGFVEAIRSLFADVSVALKSREVLTAIALVGIPAKALLTGVIVFALPLLMAASGYRQEDIGQLLMLYAGGVVVANSYIPKLVDRTGQTANALVIGAVMSAVGLLCLSLGGLQTASLAKHAAIDVFMLIAGVLLVGLAHGLINAPIISHIANLPLAQQVGVGTLTATYRFLERLGHIAGPLVVGLMFALGGQSGMILAWLSGIVLLLGCCFKFAHWKLRREDSKATFEGIGEAAFFDICSINFDRNSMLLVFRVPRGHSTWHHQQDFIDKFRSGYGACKGKPDGLYAISTRLVDGAEDDYSGVYVETNGALFMESIEYILGKSNLEAVGFCSAGRRLKLRDYFVTCHPTGGKDHWNSMRFSEEGTMGRELNKV